jgi:hypothetical protein
MRMSLYSGAGAVAAGWPRPSRGWQIPQEKNSLLPIGLLIVLYMKSWTKITVKTPHLKCRLYWCLIEFIDWRYSQSCRYFRPLLWTSASLTLSLVHLPLSSPPPFPVWISTKVSVYTVSNGGGGGTGLCGEHIQELYTVYLTRFRTYKIALPTQTKT